MLRLLTCLAFVAFLAAPLVRAADDPAWGTLKGQVVFGGASVPARDTIEPKADKAHCLEKGPLLEEKWVVDKDTKGVKWVMVWLVDPENLKKAIPVHPNVKKALPKKVSFDQPCCMFEPHVLFVVQGQTVEAKNSAPVPHNVKIDGTAGNPELNQIIPPGKSLEIEGWKSSTTLVPVSCTIHPWMNMKIRVLAHPYFAVTDAKGNWEIKNAPAGKWNIVMFHEEVGYVTGGKTGTPVEVAGGKTTDLGVTKLQAK